MSSILDRMLLALSAFSTATLCAWVLSYSSYGLDLSDEGFYLNSISRPFDYSVNIPPSLFGFVYHWPYAWLGGDVAALRVFNVVATVGLGWLLSFLVVLRFWNVGLLCAGVISAGIATLALSAFHFWLLTPSYNTLNLQALCVVMIGLLASKGSRRVWRGMGWLLVGIGGWLCSITKPTTAVALGLTILIYIVAFRRASLRPMLGSALIAFVLLLLSAHHMGGVVAVVSRMSNSAEAVTLLGSGQELTRMFRLDPLNADFWDVAAASVAALSLLLCFRRDRFRHTLINAAILSSVLALTVFIALTGNDPVDAKSASLFLVPICMALAAAVYLRKDLARDLPTERVALACIFLAVPHLFALGSNGNYWTIGAYAAIFWTLSAITFLSPLASLNRSTAILLPFAVAAQFLTVSLVNSGQEKPYRQVEDLRSYSDATVMPRGGRLILSQPSHDYYTDAVAQSRAAGLLADQPAVDLSGRSPTLLYVLESRPLGQPWLVGAYPGSNALAIRTLALESCTDLATAWLITEPDGPRHLDEHDVLASFGARETDYAVVASFNTGASGGDYPEPQKQFLLKPLRDPALASESCGEARKQFSSRSGKAQF